MTKFNSFKNLSLATIVSLATFANAENNSPLAPQHFVPLTKIDIANDKTGTMDLKANNFYLNLNKNDIQNIQKKDKEIREIFDGFSDKDINYKPVIRPIASMDSITLHPYFTFSLLLPQGAIISYVDSSTPMAVLKFDNNAVLIRPNSDFRVSNFTILYKIDETNHIMNIIANRYEKEQKEQGEKLNTLYSYTNDKKLEPLNVIHAYVMEKGKYPDKKFNYININGVSYRIVQDDKYGTEFVNGKKYRVDNNTVYK